MASGQERFSIFQDLGDASYSFDDSLFVIWTCVERDKVICHEPMFSTQSQTALRSWFRLSQPLRCRGQTWGARERHPLRTGWSVSKVSRLPHPLPSTATGSGSRVP